MDPTSTYLSNLSSIRERLSSIEKRDHEPKISLASKMSSPLAKAKAKSRRRLAVAPLPDVTLTPKETKNKNGYRTPVKSQVKDRAHTTRKDATPQSESGSKSKSRSRRRNNKDVHKSKGTSNKKKRSAKSRSNTQNIKIPAHVEFQTILRIRPLNEDERDEEVVLSSPEELFNVHRQNALTENRISKPGTIHLKPLKANPSTTPHQNASKHNPSSEAPTKFHFDHIIASDNSQRDTYTHIAGSNIAKDAVAPILLHPEYSDSNIGKTVDIEAKNHVIISMGVSNSGKTYTLLGDEQDSVENEGILPRLINDLFQVEDNCSAPLVGSPDTLSTKMQLNMSMVHIHNDRISDMLSFDKQDGRNSTVSKMIDSFEIGGTTNTKSSIPKSMAEIKIYQDKATQDFVVKPYIANCHSALEARKVLKQGLKQNTTSSTKFNRRSSRGHTIITLRPVVRLDSDDDQNSIAGASITIIDMSGIERTRSSDMNRIAMRESGAINSTISAVLQCLRVVKANQEILNRASIDSGEDYIHSSQKRKAQLVPYRENKLTMLLQPLFSGSLSHGSIVTKTKTDVKLLVSVYPGIKDYNEKKSLLTDIDQLRGLSIEGTCAIQGKIPPRNQNDSVESNKSFEEGRNCGMDDSFDSANPNRSSEEESEEPILPPNKSDEKSFGLRSPLQQTKSPLNRLVDAVKPRSSKKRKVEIQLLHDKIQELETQNELLKCEAEKSKKLCISLKSENSDLKKLLLEVEVREQQQRLNFEEKHHHENRKRTRRDDDIQLQESREWRHKHQNLLGSPLYRHMKTVETTKTIFTGRVGSQLILKSPFKLTALMKEKSNKQESIVDDTESLSSASA